MKPLGGTELLKEKLISLLEPNTLDNINLITTTCSFDLLSKDKINVLWQHLGPKQPAVQYMADRMFVDSVDHFVYVSHWQYNQFRNAFNIPDHKSTVIKNAIDPIDYVPRNNKKVKLMYTTVPWRGLVILLKCIDILISIYIRDGPYKNIPLAIQLYAKAVELGKQNSIYWIKYVKSTDLLDYIMNLRK